MKDDFKLYYNIVLRAEKIGVVNIKRRITSLMDVENAHKRFNIDLTRWLGADDENFLHDFIGIANNINRENPIDFGLFVPRFAQRG